MVGRGAGAAPGGPGGNSACAAFCAQVFGDTKAAGQCTSQAAHGAGPCYSCAGPLGQPCPLCQTCNGLTCVQEADGAPCTDVLGGPGFCCGNLCCALGAGCVHYPVTTCSDQA